MLPARVRLLLPIACLAGLVACAAPANVDHGATAAQLADKAIIIVSASHDRPFGQTASGAFLLSDASGVIKLKTSNVPIEPEISKDFKDKVGHVYVLEVTPGHHEIKSWVMGVGAFVGASPSRLPPLAFDVARGEVVYLGNLEMRTSGSVFMQAAAVVLDHGAVDIPIAETQVPAIAGKVRIALLPVGPWR